jgi:F-type H+-transporting ATPase subunit delta
MARPTTAARRYAEAAFQVAERDGTFDAWRSALGALGAALGDERLATGLANPATPLEAREKLLDAVLGSVAGAAKKAAGKPAAGAQVANLALLLLRRGRIDLLPALDDRRQGIVAASATSATPLGPDEVRSLTARLEQMTGGRVALDLSVDPSIIGGLVVRVGDRLIDGSVRGRLERLRSRLVSGAL